MLFQWKLIINILNKRIDCNLQNTLLKKEEYRRQLYVYKLKSRRIKKMQRHGDLWDSCTKKMIKMTMQLFHLKEHMK